MIVQIVCGIFHIVRFLSLFMVRIYCFLFLFVYCCVIIAIMCNIIIVVKKKGKIQRTFQGFLVLLQYLNEIFNDLKPN